MSLELKFGIHCQYHLLVPFRREFARKFNKISCFISNRSEVQMTDFEKWNQKHAGRSVGKTISFSFKTCNFTGILWAGDQLFRGPDLTRDPLSTSTRKGSFMRRYRDFPHI